MVELYTNFLSSYYPHSRGKIIFTFLLSKRRHLLDQHPGPEALSQNDAEHLPPIRVIVKNQKGESQHHRIIQSR